MKRVSTPNMGSSSGTMRSDQLILVPACCIVQGGDFRSDHSGEFRRDHDTANPIEFYSCFISYSHLDKSFARRVYETLQGRGIRCWLDEKQMVPGDSIYAEVDRGIRLWDKVVFCASRHSLTSWWVDNELDTLFEKERRLMKERGEKVLALIPLDLDGYLFNDAFEGEKKRLIQARLAADFKGWEHDRALFEREIERVIKALKPDRGKEPPPTPKL